MRLFLIVMAFATPATADVAVEPGKHDARRGAFYALEIAEEQAFQFCQRNPTFMSQVRGLINDYSSYRSSLPDGGNHTYSSLIGLAYPQPRFFGVVSACDNPCVGRYLNEAIEQLQRVYLASEAGPYEFRPSDTTLYALHQVDENECR